jgi:N-acyl-phosphatidylethanolamine-hydrolysing phospholipase D
MAEKKFAIVKDGRFENPWPYEHFTWMSGFWYQFMTKKKYPDSKFDQDFPQQSVCLRPPLGTEDNNLSCTWIGHATCLVGCNNSYIIFDPMFSDYSSPVHGFGQKRFRNPPMKVEDLPFLEAVFISHDHYDHLDKWAIKELADLQLSVKFYVPLGRKKWFSSIGLGDRTFEMNWWETKEHNVSGKRSISIQFVPAMHWSGRSLFDCNTSLWGGWVVSFNHQTLSINKTKLTRERKIETKTVYFTGDTAYHPDFGAIKDNCSKIDLALIPIGSYEPREFMKCHHCTPTEAVQIFKDCGAKKAIGIHWGCFPTCCEVMQPLNDLKEVLETEDISSDDFMTLNEGQTYWFDSS